MPHAPEEGRTSPWSATVHWTLARIREKTCRALVAGAQLPLFALAGATAFLLRFDGAIPPRQLENVWYALAVWVIVKAVVFHYAGLDRSGWRFVSLPDVRRLVVASLAGSLASVLAILIVSKPGFPRSIYFLDFALCVLYSAAARLGVRTFLERGRRRTRPSEERAFVYGAGAAGVLLIREARINSGMKCVVCGIIDDDMSKTGTTILGVRVLGPGRRLAELAVRYGVKQVVIAIPSATPAQMVQILAYCAEAKLKFRMMPAMPEVIQPHGITSQIRDVAVEDLLGRNPVRLETDNIRAKLQDETVLVTGAAGSIGSELCRQIAWFGPRAIIGFDWSETGLFFIDREMRDRFPGVRFEPVIGNIKEQERLAEVFQTHRPAFVYHAAAYKHVPMMETHLFEAVLNNVVGTFNVARAAGQFGAREFVMISSDKAVRPTSVMGLTKRVAELVVKSFQNGSTIYVSVRFGNVLGSNGSVVPIFKEQIAAGGPVTVTHPEMRRYFMTIPEAVQLVLQASLMGHGGEVFVLDMGQQVRIADLARNLILLSGLRPGEDIQINYTGIRPGEKLYEELKSDDEHTVPTAHEKVRIFAGDSSHIPDTDAFVERVSSLCARRDYSILLLMKDLVPEYNPSSHILRDVLVQKPRAMSAAASQGDFLWSPVSNAS